MSRVAVLRWPSGSDWGHVSVRTNEANPPRFVGFVRMDNPLIQELLARSGAPEQDGDMCELEFAASENVLIS